MQGDRIAAVALASLASVIVWQSTTWPAAADFATDPVVMPRSLAALMVVTAAFLAFRRRPVPEISAGAQPARVTAGAACTVAMALLLKPLGLIAAGIPYLVALMLIARAPWRKALPVAIGAPILVWLVFALLLNVPLPAGDLWSGLFAK